jgi:hypothetical protein
MRLRFWRREPMPDLAVDQTADLGVAPLDRGGATEATPSSGYDGSPSYGDTPGSHELSERVERENLGLGRATPSD